MAVAQKLIGLTGGIGSGKSTVARALRWMGIPVFDADSEVKQLYLENASLRKEMVQHFGADIFIGAHLQSKVLADRLFANASHQALMGNILAPYLKERFETWRAAHTHVAWVAKEAAILIESGSYKDCDFIVQVIAPKALRLARVQQRNGMKPEEIEERMRAQMTDEERRVYCHFEILNDEQTALLPQLMALRSHLKD